MTFTYPGNELDLFRDAIQWKQYFAERLGQYITGDVLEVGAGIGATSRFLCDGSQTSWTCLEPDASLAARLVEGLAARPLPTAAQALCQTIDALPRAARFDTVLYIDVLEHIEDDRAELVRASSCLRDGGRIIALSPAHQWLFSRFDHSIGHYRRYTASSLAAITPPELTLARTFYLDSAGMVASAANRWLLHEAYPSARQIRFWDTHLVRISRASDRLTGYRLGKTVIGVWVRGRRLDRSDR
jgi:SAM-dependent methyltransferase